MNQFAQLTVISAVSSGFLVWRQVFLAYPAQARRVPRTCLFQPFSANAARGTVDWSDCRKAFGTNWQAGNVDEGGSEEAAFSREEGWEGAARRPGRPRKGRCQSRGV